MHVCNYPEFSKYTWIILGMGSANERRRYNVKFVLSLFSLVKLLGYSTLLFPIDVIHTLAIHRYLNLSISSTKMMIMLTQDDLPLQMKYRQVSNIRPTESQT